MFGFDCGGVFVLLYWFELTCLLNGLVTMLIFRLGCGCLFVVGCVVDLLFWFDCLFMLVLLLLLVHVVLLGCLFCYWFAAL